MNSLIVPDDLKLSYSELVLYTADPNGHHATSWSLMLEINTKLASNPERYSIYAPLARWLLRDCDLSKNLAMCGLSWMNHAARLGSLEDVVLGYNLVRRYPNISQPTIARFCHQAARIAVERDHFPIAQYLIQLTNSIYHTVDQMKTLVCAVLEHPEPTYLAMLDLVQYQAVLRNGTDCAPIQMIRYLAEQRVIDSTWWRSLLREAVVRNNQLRVRTLWELRAETANHPGCPVADFMLAKRAAMNACYSSSMFGPYSGLDALLALVPESASIAQCLVRCLLKIDFVQTHHLLEWILERYPIDLLAQNCEMLTFQNTHEQMQEFLANWFLEHSICYHGSRVSYFRHVETIVIGCDRELPIYGRCSFQIYDRYLYLSGCLPQSLAADQVVSISSYYGHEYPLAKDEEPIEIYPGPHYATRVFLRPPELLVAYWTKWRTSQKSARSALAIE